MMKLYHDFLFPKGTCSLLHYSLFQVIGVKTSENTFCVQFSVGGAKTIT